MGKHMHGMADFVAMYNNGDNVYDIIIAMMKTLPIVPVVLVWLICTMIAFYATSFDSIAFIASCYSYRKLDEGKNPNKLVELMWCLLLILLPIALLFSESSMTNIQAVSIIAAFPLAFVLVLIAISFIKDGKKYMGELKEKKRN